MVRGDKIVEVQEKIDRFNVLQKKSNLEDKEKQELNRLAEEFLVITKQTYDKTAITYSQVNETRMMTSVAEKIDILFEIAKEVLNKSISEMSILDVGTGPGRDIKYIYSKGVEKVIGLDNSEGFIKLLSELAMKKVIPEDSFVKGDMLNLPFDNKTFDIVRENASLLHIPITTKGEMLDKVMQENNRVLKENGLIYVSVKKGEGIRYIDTKDGLGGRIFQLHTIETITKMIEQNKFKILNIKEEVEERNGDIINWIYIIAKKLKK